MKTRLLALGMGLGMMLVLAPMFTAVRAQESARPTPVEVIVPAEPVPVAAEGKRVLAYELHITNFGRDPLTLQRLEVYGGAPAPLATFEGATLAQMISLVGQPMDMSMGKAPSQSPRLDPGRRLIVYMWLALPLHDAVPASLRHRLSFTVEGGEGAAKESHIDGIMVPVSTERAPRLLPPLRSGEWLAGNGPGISSGHRRTVVALKGRAYSSQRFAIDWTGVGKNTNTFHDSREKNENFWGYGQPVYAVASGEVTEVVDKFPDNKPDHLPQPVTLENIAGNHVIVRIAPDRYVLFAHLKAGSVRVRVHQQVTAQDVIAQVGNSGQTTAPHLHLQVMDADSALAAEGVPYVFHSFTFLGYGRDFEEDKHPSVPKEDELPLDDYVVGFDQAAR
ncbi:MAG TPA: M23 family metallopeptidase [Terriglobales bacterium]|jgi:murein DD-endopeptidase MepM/ murein hydrolase activator NlpD|nr:M23 family metallopeptidase [Terriglobales bacterium]